MKQSMIIGVIMLYVILLGLQMFVTQTLETSATGLGQEIEEYGKPAYIQGHINPDTAASSAEINAGTIAKSVWNVGNMAMLRFPALFHGHYVWFYWIVCFPIAVSFWVVIFSIFRGVGST